MLGCAARRDVKGWVVPSILYAFCTGTIGVTAKVALRSMTWRDLVVWAAIAYAAVAVALVVAGGARLHLAGSGLALVSGALAVSGIALLGIAVSHAEVSRVVPLTSAYPVVTVALSVVFLSERLSWQRIVGTVLVVAGVIFLSR